MLSVNDHRLPSAFVAKAFAGSSTARALGTQWGLYHRWGQLVGCVLPRLPTLQHQMRKIQPVLGRHGSKVQNLRPSCTQKVAL